MLFFFELIVVIVLQDLDSLRGSHITLDCSG